MMNDLEARLRAIERGIGSLELDLRALKSAAGVAAVGLFAVATDQAGVPTNTVSTACCGSVPKTLILRHYTDSGATLADTATITWGGAHWIGTSGANTYQLFAGNATFPPSSCFTLARNALGVGPCTVVTCSPAYFRFGSLPGGPSWYEASAS